MKIMILSLIILITLAATMAGYDLLESSANMVEMLMLPFTPEGRTAAGALVFGGPFLILFIGAFVVMFIGVPLVASALAGCLGGWRLRRSGRSISRRTGWICSVIAAASAIALVLGVIQRDVLPLERPRMRPKTSPVLLACLAGANAALSVYVGTFVLRKVTLLESSSPTSNSTPTKVIPSR